MVILLHALIGIVGFVSAGVLGISFMGHTQELSATQRWSLILTVSAVGITAVLGLYYMAGIWGALVSGLLLAYFEYVCFFKEPKTVHEHQ
ncbi:hypothetical protein M3M39_01465 [Fructilactobacillus hinvesii]|uniref:Uncharacterized protein n=1 Tax=Fructilactobacillus hinvesii TaxID=2940300 RepID=A0ABY5BSS2_9LACO|nr:hypothetical protein [Fructilactobacillus hinvesii]USS88177.1 hypothetical protein M3M39_01465 [Fructilactobacillus hinvesii]